ncbi:MAG: 16S rRNA (uracil(1498)-N(3))-methyltransferase [Kistimonas sp.]|nr:16S rRNA (uracil(1498)-N(3))-methyltransferase [Kistimonas sp.]
MRYPRIHAALELNTGQAVDLPDTASTHVGRVLRKKEGDLLLLFNGKGEDWLCRISAMARRSVQVVPLEKVSGHRESPLRIHLGQALSRGERMSYAIQKAVECGVTEITPLFTDRCEVKLSGSSLEKRLNHWNQVVISACEQCGRNIIPAVHAPVPLSAWLSRQDTDLRLVLQPQAQDTPLSDSQPRSVSLLIGPEGGLCASEVSQSHEHRFLSWRLGPRVLRTETAPVAAISLLQYLWGDTRAPACVPDTRGQHA